MSDSRRIAFTIPSTEYGSRTGRRTVAPKSGKFSPDGMSIETLLTGLTYPPPPDAHRRTRWQRLLGVREKRCSST